MEEIGHHENDKDPGFEHDSKAFSTVTLREAQDLNVKTKGAGKSNCSSGGKHGWWWWIIPISACALGAFVFARKKHQMKAYTKETHDNEITTLRIKTRCLSL